MTVAERFLFALADGRPPAQSEALLRLLDAVPAEDSETYRRLHARELAKVAVSYAIRALEADEQTAAAAGGLRSIPFSNEEDASYIAERLRETYAPAVPSPELRAVLEHAAAACDAADELRLLTRGRENQVPDVSETRTVNEDAYNAVAEETAETIRAAALPLGLDLYRDADIIVKRLTPPPGAAFSG